MYQDLKDHVGGEGINVILASPRGFCFGVERAIQIAKQSALLYKQVYVVEDVVHSSRVMEDLARVGIIKVDSIAHVPEGSVFMISAHGMSPTQLSELPKTVNIVDTTCKIVAAIQKKIYQDSLDGKKIIIIGKRNHAEVVGYLGYANYQDIYVVYDKSDITLLPDFTHDSVSCYSQTTLVHSFVNSLFSELQAKIPHIQCSANENLNVCNATSDRQKAVIDISQKYGKEIDLFIVCGSKHSSNTVSLVDTIKSNGIENTILVDSVLDLSLDLFVVSNECSEEKGESSTRYAKNIAITSGASCPEDVVQEVIGYIRDNISRDLNIIGE